MGNLDISSCMYKINQPITLTKPIVRSDGNDKNEFPNVVFDFFKPSVLLLLHFRPTVIISRSRFLRRRASSPFSITVENGNDMLCYANGFNGKVIQNRKMR